MNQKKSPVSYYSSRYHAKAACRHCDGIIRHERWCTAVNPIVSYAFDIVADARRLTNQGRHSPALAGSYMELRTIIRGAPTIRNSCLAI